MVPLETRRIRAWLAVVSLAALGVSEPNPTIEVEPPPEPIDWSVAAPKVFDAAVLRPLGACATVVGAGAFVVAAPLATFSIGWRSVWDSFVITPVDFTFVRPLGEF